MPASNREYFDTGASDSTSRWTWNGQTITSQVVVDEFPSFTAAQVSQLIQMAERDIREASERSAESVRRRFWDITGIRTSARGPEIYTDIEPEDL